MGVNTVNVKARLLYCNLTLGQNCPIVATNHWTENWTNAYLPIYPRQQHIIDYITNIYHQHLHKRDCCTLLNDLLPTTVRLNAGETHVPSSNTLWLVTLKIYTCNLTALNILRHFYNSIDLLVSSATMTEHWALKKRQKEKWHVSIIFTFLEIVILWLFLHLSSIWDCLTENTYFIWVIHCLSQGWFPNNMLQRQDVFPLHCEVCFCLGCDVMFWRLPFCYTMTTLQFIVSYYKTMHMLT